MHFKFHSLLLISALFCTLTSGIATTCWGSPSPSTEVVVLVPGFFNSLAPGGTMLIQKHPYFSDDIVSVFEQRKYKVYVVDNLDPVGSIVNNTNLLKTYLKYIETREPHKTMLLVGHSAGGLYSLQASSADPSLPIRQISTLGTPFSGLRFLENLEKSRLPTDIILKFMNLSSLVEFTTQNMKGVISALRLNPELKIDINYGYQLSTKMTFPMRLANRIGAGASDGIVTLESATDIDFLKSAGSQNVSVQRDDYIHLEHWQQVLSYRMFSIFNIDLDAIRAEQIRYYNKIADNF